MIKKTHIISIIAIVAFLGIGATWVITKATNSTQVLPDIIKEVPEFSLVSHHGELFTRDSLLNKISVLDSNADLELEAAGTGSVVVNDILNLMETPGVDDATVDPGAPTEGIKLYSKTQGTGDTGLYFVNKKYSSTS